MYRESFPKCKIEGSFKPVEFGHMVSEGAIPHKCISCSHMFEGECLRGNPSIDGFLRLDYEPCGIDGSTEPIEIEKHQENSIFVPTKCESCSFLKKDDIRHYICSKDREVWGDFPRDLDWGNWKPDYPLIRLIRYEEGKYSRTYLGPATITKELVLLLKTKEIVEAIYLYRKLNHIETFKEAKEDVEKLLAKLKKVTKENE